MEYIISIIACDRAGIVAGVSQAIFNMGGNMIAASQTVLQGYFAMIIKCQFESNIDISELKQHVNDNTEPGLHIYITPYVSQPERQEATGQHFIVTALGPDRPGILSALSSYLGSKKINITDLYCYVDNGGEFVVICQVTVPDETDIVMIQADLDALGREIAVGIQMRQENIFVATNELRLPAAR